MPEAYQTFLTRDVFSSEERSVVLWRMAVAIYDVHASATKVGLPFSGIPIAEREIWIQCARAALRAMVAMPKDEPIMPLEL